MFHLFFQTYIASVFISMLHMFHTYVASVFIWMLQILYNCFTCFQVFLQVFHMHVSSVSSAFRRMLQVLHLDVSKVDRVLHLPPRFPLPRLCVSSSSQHRLGIRRPLPLFSMLVTVCRRGRPDAPSVWALASPLAKKHKES